MREKRLHIRENWIPIIGLLPDEKLGELIKAIVSHALEEDVCIDDPVLNALYLMMVLAIDEERKSRGSPEYKMFRENVLERGGYTCQLCGCSEDIMHVHHIKPYSIYTELRTEPSNGITLCPKCHREVHR